MKPKTSDNTSEETDQVPVEQVRKFVMRLLKRNSPPQGTAQALCYIAVEMSLQIAENKLRVMPLLMEAMAAAARAHEQIASDQPTTEAEVALCERESATLH